VSALDIEMRITSFSDVTGSRRGTTWMSLGQFAAAAIAQAHAPNKASLPLMKLAAFGERRSTKGSLRHDRNVLEVGGCELDYDGEELSLDQAEAILRTAKMPGIIYSSPSHTPAKPRFRIVVPFSIPRPPEWRAKMVSRVAGLFPVQLAPESWTLSQAYYYGSIHGQPPVIIIEVDGDDFVCVDLRDDLDAGAMAKPCKGNGANGQADDWFDPGHGGVTTDEGKLLARITSGSEGTHDALISLAGLLARRGTATDDLITELTDTLERRPETARNADWHKHLADIPRIVQWVLGKEQERRAAAADPWAQPHATAVEPEEIEQQPEEWPEPMALAAFRGPLGQAVAEIMPHTEADPHALLLQILAFFGNKIGCGPHVRIGASEHATNLYELLAGNSSRSRKGTSESEVRGVFASDPVDQWLLSCVQAGLSTGEGLVNAVRDERWGKNKKGELELLDEGVPDKRLLAVESEFASVLAVMKREGNTLSAVLRVAWDRGTLQTMTRNSPLKATGALISVIAHITIDELRAGVDRIALSNGLLNRFLFAVVKRSRLLPHGGNVNQDKLHHIGEHLNEAVRAARLVGAVSMAPSAADLWTAIYPELTTDHPGLFGSLIARAEAHTIRLALIYALADQKAVIEPTHLESALAVWKYSEDSARVLFGDLIGDPVADALVIFLRAAGSAGATRTELYNALGRNMSSARIQIGLMLLARQGRARRTKGGIPGRSGPFTERWFYIRGRRS
jgi:Protein of unknown function (DUF3987)